MSPTNMIMYIFLFMISISNGEMPGFWNSNLRSKSDKAINDFHATMKGVQFSGVFTDRTVLQRGPHLASVYGAADTPNTKISLTISGSGYNKVLTTNSAKDGSWKITLTDAMNAGGNYIFNVKCPSCKDTQIEDTLHEVTFGDVYYCAGQSNMQLKMHWTFSRNDTYNAVKKGKYSEIRSFTMWEIDTSTPTYVVPHKGPGINNNNIMSINWNITNAWNTPSESALDTFSAPCWYFGQSLVDMYDITTPIGLIDVAIGGTQIEQWTKNHTIEQECKGSVCPNAMCGGLYNGMVLPFVNMTIKSYLWWQGENNMQEQTGNWVDKTGYACMQPLMLNQWRSIWNYGHNIPFGLVTLAAGTSEGHQTKMGDMRWAQTANFDYLPNTEMTNTFVALGHDMGEPWGSNCVNQKPMICNTSGAPYSLLDTPWHMGPIHPRVKQPIGERLAYAGYNMLYGNSDKQQFPYPLISECTLNENAKQIIVTFNSTFLGNEKVKVIPWSAWYNKNLHVEDWSAMQVLIGQNWQFVDNITESSINNEIIVDIKSFNGDKITGLRYGYGDFMCCGNLDKDKNPCPPNQCPIKVVNDKITLPAVPFSAQITNNKCHCTQPQTC